MATLQGGERLESFLAAAGRAIGQKATLRVGFLESATYPDGTPVAMVAAIQEFGAPRARIPPRPFFRNMIASKSGEWPRAIANLLHTTGYDVQKTLALTGEAIRGQLAQSISDTNAPPLSPITLMLRKMFGNDHSAIRGRDVGIAAARVAAGESTAGVSTKPLVWTGHLQNSIDYEIKT